MSTAGRGRGYTGRHHMRDPRPGDPELTEELDSARTLTDVTTRATTDTVKQDIPKQEMKELREEKKEVRPEVKHRVSAEDEAALHELLTIDEQYRPLLVLLEQFSPGEDGIQFNRKLRAFETTVSSMCPDEARLHQAFCTFRAAALLSSVTSRKLSAVGASFTRQQRQQLLRGALLNVVMQGTFSKLDLLERANPLFLINAANLMGDYFAEARLCNGNKVHILASPLLQYMRALLTSDDIRAHRSLATQLMQNGRELLSVLSQELDDLSISIRLRLLTPPPVSIIWLLLSADLCLNKFLPLPNTLQQFYAAHLELTSDENFSEVSYGSWKKSPEKDEYKSDSSEVSTDIGNISTLSLNDEGDGLKPKLRPILGAGAGLLRQEQALSVSQDSFDTWTTKNSLSKRYDLNSWRQAEEDKEEAVPEPVFNPSVLPPNLTNIQPPNLTNLQAPNITNIQPVQNPTVPQSFPITVPDYPPPNINKFNNFPQDFNYLQQGDGAYIQNQYPTNSNFSSQGDFVQFTNDKPNIPERVNNEVQKNSSRKPVENWRREKSDVKEDANRNRSRNWNRQSKDSINDEDDDRSTTKSTRDLRGKTRRSSSEDVEGKTAKPRHVSDVPRNHKYWDHDDRCDKDYNS